MCSVFCTLIRDISIFVSDFDQSLTPNWQKMHFTGRKDTLGSALWQAIKLHSSNQARNPAHQGFLQIGNSYEENPFLLIDFGPPLQLNDSLDQADKIWWHLSEPSSAEKQVNPCHRLQLPHTTARSKDWLLVLWQMTPEMLSLHHQFSQFQA